MMNMKLNVMSRLMILTNLPTQGTTTEMIAKRNIRTKIDFSSKEVEDLKLDTVEDRITWSNEGGPIEFEFNDSEIAVLKKIVNHLDESGLITDQTLEFAEQILNI